MDTAQIATLDPQRDAASSGVSWGAVIGGSFVAAALSLILLALGAGFGLSVISPWSNVGASAGVIGVAAIVWLIVVQVVAYAMGGYLAGRLRTRWRRIHGDEVHFRDTANGFLVWAVSVVMTVSLLAAAATAMVGGAAKSDGVPEAASNPGLRGNSYFIDRLFRSDHPGPAANEAGVKGEAARIFAHSFGEQLPSPDTQYLAELVVVETGITPNDAQKRVMETVAAVRQREDTARKETARLLLWTFLALLIGAFCASYAATIGGRQRDHVEMLGEGRSI